MKIFDGVELPQPMSPLMREALSWFTLLSKVWVEAGNVRDERLAGEGEGRRPTTLEQVMAQAGLKIPSVEEVLAQMMGNGEDAKQAASLLANSTDSAAILHAFAAQLGLSITIEPTGPSATKTPPPAGPKAKTPPPGPTPPPAGGPAAQPPSASHSPPAAPPASPAASKAPVAPTSPPSRDESPPAFRPEFTREAATAAHAGGLQPAAFRPEFTREGRDAAKTATASPSAPPTDAPRPSLVDMVERWLGALRRKLEVHKAELDTRLARAESELEALRRHFRERVAVGPRPVLEVAPPAAGEPVPQVAAEAPDPKDMVSTEAPAAQEAPTASEASTRAVEPPPPSVLSGTPAEEPAAPLPVVATEADLVRAADLIDAFGDELEAHHQHGAERLAGVEHELRVLRALVGHPPEVDLSHEGPRDEPEEAATHG